MRAFLPWNTISNAKLTNGGDEVAIIPGLGYETIVPSVETDLENPNRICCSHYWCQIRNTVIFGRRWNISVHVNVLGEHTDDQQTTNRYLLLVPLRTTVQAQLNLAQQNLETHPRRWL